MGKQGDSIAYAAAEDFSELKRPKDYKNIILYMGEDSENLPTRTGYLLQFVIDIIKLYTTTRRTLTTRN